MTMLGAGAIAPNATVAGVDIGGTKTHLRVRSPAGVDDLILPTSDWRCRDWLSDAKAVTELVKKLADGRCIDALAVGAHGCDDRAECEAFENAFKAVEFAPARVVNDAELMPAAFGLEGQIGVVAGTGSIAVCRSAEGEMLVAGGWGWIIGDEGSAPSLVREAARAVALHFDHGGVPDEPLVQSLFKALDIPTPARIGTCLSNLRSSKEVGRHAHVIFEAANAGSKLADAV